MCTCGAAIPTYISDASEKLRLIILPPSCCPFDRFLFIIIIDSPFSILLLLLYLVITPSTSLHLGLAAHLSIDTDLVLRFLLALSTRALSFGPPSILLRSSPQQRPLIRSQDSTPPGRLTERGREIAREKNTATGKGNGIDFEFPYPDFFFLRCANSASLLLHLPTHVNQPNIIKLVVRLP